MILVCILLDPPPAQRPQCNNPPKSQWLRGLVVETKTTARIFSGKKSTFVHVFLVFLGTDIYLSPYPSASNFRISSQHHLCDTSYQIFSCLSLSYLFPVSHLAAPDIVFSYLISSSIYTLDPFHTRAQGAPVLSYP